MGQKSRRRDRIGWEAFDVSGSWQGVCELCFSRFLDASSPSHTSVRSVVFFHSKLQGSACVQAEVWGGFGNASTVTTFQGSRRVKVSGSRQIIDEIA